MGADIGLVSGEGEGEDQGSDRGASALAKVGESSGNCISSGSSLPSLISCVFCSRCSLLRQAAQQQIRRQEGHFQLASIGEGTSL